MAPPLGFKPPQKLCRCLGCGCSLLRRNHLTTARCDPCKDKAKNGTQKAEIRLRRTEARRYRILMHLLGYEHDQFEELVQQIKHSPMLFDWEPRTRLAKLDRTLEEQRGTSFRKPYTRRGAA